MNKYAIGKRIESCREKRGMSTQELASRIKRSQASISRIENGKQGISFELLEEIAGALQVHPFRLLSDAPPHKTPVIPRAAAETGPRYTPNLLANALRGGRLRRNLSLGAVAKLLDLDPRELEAEELGLACPTTPHLRRLCDLYGLDPQEMQLILDFGQAVPDFAKGLAYLQNLFAHCREILANYPAGEESRILDKIRHLLDSAETDSPPSPESSSDEVSLFLLRLSNYLASTIKDMDLRGVMQLARVNHGENDTQ